MFASSFNKFVAIWLLLLPFLFGFFDCVGKPIIKKESRRLEMSYRTRFPKALCRGFSHAILMTNAIITILGWMRYWDAYRLPSVMSLGWSVVFMWIAVVITFAFLTRSMMEQLYLLGASFKMFITERSAKFNKHHYQIDRTGTYITLPINEYLGRKTRKSKKVTKGERSKVVDIQARKTERQTSGREAK